MGKYKRFLLEAKIDDLLKSSRLSDVDQVTVRKLNDQLVNRTKYVPFLIKNYKVDDIVNLINGFDKRQSRFENKDINSYDVVKLRSLVEPELDKKTKTEIKSSGVDKIYEDNDYLLLLLKNKEASCYYGKGTKWCISSTESENYFDKYDQDTNLYVLFNKKLPETNIRHKLAIAITKLGISGIFNTQDNDIYDKNEQLPIPQKFVDMMKQPGNDKITKNWTKNSDGSYSTDGDVKITSNFVKDGKLIFRFKHVGGYFDCSYNQLTSLEGCPTSVGMYFDCSHNQLTSLEGCPTSVGGNFRCSYNKTEFTEKDVRSICKVKYFVYV